MASPRNRIAESVPSQAPCAAVPTRASHGAVGAAWASLFLLGHRGCQSEETLQSLGQALGLDRDLPCRGERCDAIEHRQARAVPGNEPGGVEGDVRGGGVAANACSTGAVDGSPARSCHCPANCTVSVSPSRRVASVAAAGAIEADARIATAFPLHDPPVPAKRSRCRPILADGSRTFGPDCPISRRMRLLHRLEHHDQGPWGVDRARYAHDRRRARRSRRGSPLARRLRPVSRPQGDPRARGNRTRARAL